MQNGTVERSEVFGGSSPNSPTPVITVLVVLVLIIAAACAGGGAGGAGGAIGHFADSCWELADQVDWSRRPTNYAYNH